MSCAASTAFASASIRGFSALIVTALLLAGCGGSTSSAITESTTTTRASNINNALAQVRAAGVIGNELDVRPLRDPQVEDLRSAATRAEERGDFAGAQGILTRALLITPDDPELLQWQAELALVEHQWAQAEQLATRSYAKGPQLGGLCRRNWTTLRIAAQARGDGAAAAQAQQRVSVCTVAPPTRM